MTDGLYIASTIALLAVFLIAGTTELPRTSRSRSARKARWILNLALAAMNYGAIGATTQLLLANYLRPAFSLMSDLWPSGLHGALAAFILLDLFRYWLHRIFHAIPVLWRLHSLHHSDDDVDVTTTFRHNPIEFALLSFLIVIPQMVLGLPTVAVMIYAAIANVLSVIGHANLPLPRSLERAIGGLILTPDFHALHHSIDPTQHHKNFGSVLTIWDRIFDTFSPAQSLRTGGILFGVQAGSFASKT